MHYINIIQAITGFAVHSSDEELKRDQLNLFEVLSMYGICLSKTMDANNYENVLEYYSF